MKDKEIFKALVDISEVLYELVSNSYNYSQEAYCKLNKALTSINNCSPREAK